MTTVEMNPDQKVADPRDVETARFFLKQPPDHQGHANCVLHMFPDRFRHNSTHGWTYWNGKHWQGEGAEEALTRAISHVLEKRRMVAARDENKRLLNASWGNRANISGTAALMEASKEVFTPIDRFDNHPDLLNCANGTVDLRTGQIIDHDPDHLLTYCLATPFDPNADFTEWLLWLGEIGMDTEMEQYLKMAVGYTLTGHTGERCLFYVYGPTAAGKGTFLETLQHVLKGPLEAGVNFQMFTSERANNTSNFDLAPLTGTRYVVASESNRHRRLNAEMVKSITGGDAIYCSFKMKDHFSYFPQYKVWVSSNWKPNADVEDDALWGRLHLITFPRSFKEEGIEDKTIKRRLRAPESLRGILAWAVQGSVAWYARGGEGIIPPQRIRDAVDSRREELDTVGQFVDQMCLVDLERVDGHGNPEVYTEGKAMYQEYKSWCEDEGNKPLTRRRFSESLGLQGIESKPRRFNAGKIRRVYYGIGLIEEAGGAVGAPIVL